MEHNTSTQRVNPPAAKPLLAAGGRMQKMYVMVSKRGQIDHRTLSCQRKTCIEYFLHDTTVTWEDCKKHGWVCLKVDVAFTACS